MWAMSCIKLSDSSRKPRSPILTPTFYEMAESLMHQVITMCKGYQCKQLCNEPEYLILESNRTPSTNMKLEPEYFALSVNYDFMEPIARGKIRGWDMRANYGKVAEELVKKYAEDRKIPTRFLPYLSEKVYNVSDMFYREAPLSPPLESQERERYIDCLGSSIVPLNTDSEPGFRAGDFLDSMGLLRLRGWPTFMRSSEFSEFTLWSLLANPSTRNIGMKETKASIEAAFKKGLDVDAYRLVGRVEHDLLDLAKAMESKSKYRLHYADPNSLELMCKLELNYLVRLPGLATALRTTTRKNPDPIYIPRRDAHHEPHFLGNMLTLTWNTMELEIGLGKYPNLSIEIFEGLPTFRGTIMGDTEIIFMAMPPMAPGVISKGLYVTGHEFVSLARDRDIRMTKLKDKLDSQEQIKDFIRMCKDKIKGLTDVCSNLQPGLQERTAKMIGDLCLQSNVIPRPEARDALARAIFEDCYDLQPLYEVSGAQKT